jgi:hypothetical protein
MAQELELELEPAPAPAPNFDHQPYAPAHLQRPAAELPPTDSETESEDADIEDHEDRPLLSVTAGPGKGEGGIPWGNFNYPVTATHGARASLTCEYVPPS